ncbi:rpl11a [Symbiodinium natans]|uniref:Rpl11a protein n=1 Tax=Symbiodinium natans TaxID=878477 RepID=A0A812RM00_9DINO|nr:rpl11a [Symbiodinium natans]
MGCCCMGLSRSVVLDPEQPLDHKVYAESFTRHDRAKVWESVLKQGGQEIMRFNEVEDIRFHNPMATEFSRVGVLVLTELFLWWHAPPAVQSPSASVQKMSKRARLLAGSSIVVGYGMIEEVGIVCFDAGGCAVRIVAREAFGEQFEMVLRVLQPAETLPAFTTTIPEESGPEGNEAWHQMLASFLDKALKAYNWAHYFLHCALRQRDLFAHKGVAQPELSFLPNEEAQQDVPSWC